MASVIKIKLEEYIQGPLVAKMNEAIQYAKEKIDEKTPEDTRTLIKGNKVKKATLRGTLLVASVENRTEYAEVVEYGRGAKTMNYHKYPPGTKKTKKNAKRYVIRTGIGARMYTLTKDLNEKEILAILRK